MSEFLFSILGIISFIIGTGLFIFKKYRTKIQVKVNCWFCNNYYRVPFQNRNNWDCPNCEQYNGFTSDGDYNKIIPEQHVSSAVNSKITCSNENFKTPSVNRLCYSCTLNQELKVQQLSAFKPFDEENFDEEIDEFRNHLEKAYALCSKCEEVVKDVLLKQDNFLIGCKFRNNIKSRLRNCSKFASALQIFQLNKKVFQLITFAASACLLSAFIVHVNHGQVLPPSLVSVLPQWLPTLPTFVIKSLHYFLNVELIITGTVLVIQLLTFLAKPWKFGDLIICTCWILIHLQCWLGNWPGIRSYVSLVDFTSIHVMSLFVTFIGCACSVIRPKTTKCLLKKMPSAGVQLTKRERMPSEINSNINKDSPDVKDCQKSFKINPSPNPLNHSFPATIHAHHNEETISNISSPKLFKNHNFFPLSSSALNSTNIEKTFIPGDFDLDNRLGNLNLGGSSRPASRASSRSSFLEPRVYDQKTSTSTFPRVKMDSGSYQRPRPVLSPPRFNSGKNVTQSSWLAGGYWQTPNNFNTTPLSRSSSQSSGFGSMSSRLVLDAAVNLPGSRSYSVCGNDSDQVPAYPQILVPIYRNTCFTSQPVSYIPHPYVCCPANILTQAQVNNSGSSCSSESCKSEGLLPHIKENLVLSTLFISSVILNILAACFYTVKSVGN